MSLVGPRPLLMQYLDRYTPEQARRHDVLPGITGWAQINGRNALTWEEKFRLDVWYVDHWSLWLDFKILLHHFLEGRAPGGHQPAGACHGRGIHGQPASQPTQAGEEASRACLLNGSPQTKSCIAALYRIRRFEETVLENFSKGVFYGTTHTYLGQEANAVGVLRNLQAGDIVFSNHRCHGHFLAYGGDPRALFAELMGKASGVCGGRGGSQHLHWRNFYSNGVQGGIVPVATGMALAEKRKGSRAVTVAFLGDGTLGEGVVYEALNMAALWKAPILYVVENNRIAQTTPIEAGSGGQPAGPFPGLWHPGSRAG